MLDERWIRSLHVESMRRADLHGGHEPHVLFQASTIGALLEGAYEGDLSFAELAEHGDLGLGTLNRLDGEMIALDGDFFRADVDGNAHPVAPEEKTPFAVVTEFEAIVDARLPEAPRSHEELLAVLDGLLPAGAVSCAVRLDGSFELVRARSVPAQSPPYRPLTEVVADQHVFDLADVEGTMLGFRFPAFAEGIEVGGYHLHFISADRRRGGHVLDSRTGALRARLDPSNNLHVELPPRVELGDPDLASETHAAVAAVERQQRR
ncbi:MAG TPA: acetolactate decarboxylase [Solirubrobacterales bacterium]|nr:acetolactate decarboxylase [Solirubrobacterales bacterium]